MFVWHDFLGAHVYVGEDPISDDVSVGPSRH